MPTPFKNTMPSSQQINGDRVLFPSEQPRLNPNSALQGQSPNLGDEVFHHSNLSPHDGTDNGLGLHGLHTPQTLDLHKNNGSNDSLTFQTYTNPLDNHINYGVHGLDFNPTVLPISYNQGNADDPHGAVMAAFFPNSDGGPKLDSHTEAPYGTGIGTGNPQPSQISIKEEAQSGGETPQRTPRPVVPGSSSKAATISGSNSKIIPPPINTDAQSPQIGGGGGGGGTKSQHNTWRRGNKGRTPLSVKRSQSTPNVQLAAQLAAASAVSAPPIPSANTTDDISPVTLAYQLDKKRNKLGYHRTSVACGHCRRRKIRCILAKDESGRCSNCIRLKKECSFYPVESADRRPRSASKPEISSQIFQDNCSSPSSPTRSPRLSVDQINMAPVYDGSLYPSSLPITPNYECETPTSTFDETYRNRSFSSSSRASLAFSNSGSRRPSLAHMFTAPLPSREFRSLSDASPTYMETFSSFASRFGNSTKAIGIGIEDPTSSFWRLENASNNFSPLSQHINFGGMPSLQEDSVRHERLNSVDNGVGPMAQSYADPGLFSVGSDPPIENIISHAAKAVMDVQTSQAFIEGAEAFPVDGGYDLPWNDPSKGGASGIAHSSSLAENWFLPQQSITDMVCDPDSLQHLNQTALGVKHE
ncbi:hypothetical protein AOL_s00112g130 [Orbilia oligospora ATCC 24927]|uniref:Zn(2)-C6 fungal-type domain-containing protein n=2 Tax=Orbilia oligospora TaxID=2813651 RepID=G1XLV0_ARTOA|nr:hypothetical protein AOL_s00112g130 [Orbilia oligospora ATCC 24927]EGX45941.1 hypothetical protein AOL_s00112g130 [Orbilia oligospora ATCC 24927]